MHIEEIQISNFRSIYDLKTKLYRYTILIGRNNSGKTSIIEAILLLLKIIEEGYGKETVEDPKLLDNLKHAAFYASWDKPITISGLIALDATDNDAIKELIDVCGLSEEIKYIDVSVYMQKKTSTIEWGIEKLDVLGYVSETTKLAAQKIGEEKYSRCTIIKDRHVKNERGYQAIRKLISNRVVFIKPYAAPRKSTDRITDILARELLIYNDYANLIEQMHSTMVDRLKFFEQIKRVEGEEEIQMKLYYYASMPLSLFGGGDQVIQAIMSKILNAKPGSIVLIEEPEIHQHPLFVKNLAETLEQIAEESNFQIIITTHSPTFVRAVRRKDRIIIVHKRLTNIPRIGEVPVTNITTIGEEVAQELSVLSSELGLPISYPFFLDAVILVEGYSDKVLIKRYIDILRRKDLLKNLARIHYEIETFSRTEEKLTPWIHILRKLGVRVFVIVDGDDAGRSYISRVKELGLREGEEAFMLNKEDILGYIDKSILVKALRTIIDSQFADVVNNMPESARNKLEESINSLGEKGFDKKVFEIIVSILFDNMGDEKKRVHNKDFLGSIIKSRIAELVLRDIKDPDDVPSDIKEHLIVIDRNLGV